MAPQSRAVQRIASAREVERETDEASRSERQGPRGPLDSAPVTRLRETRIRDNVWVWTLGGETMATSYGANCTAVLGWDAVLLVDPFITPAHARRVERALREKTSLPLRHVVLTHHHTDHALGAGWFAARGKEVVAHRACRDRMGVEHPGLVFSRRCEPEVADLFRDAEPYLPSRTFEEGLTLDLGGTRARIIHPGHNHTPGDAVVHLLAESVVVCGDLVSNAYHVNYEDAKVKNLERGLETLRALGASAYVPGHGPTGGIELLDAQARYHREVREAVLREANADAALDRVRTAFPDHLLGAVLPSALAAWRSSEQSPDS